jgi:hypothetical protein
MSRRGARRSVSRRIATMPRPRPHLLLLLPHPLPPDRLPHLTNAAEQLGANEWRLAMAAPIPQDQSAGAFRIALDRRHPLAVLAGRRVVDVRAVQRRRITATSLLRFAVRSIHSIAKLPIL